jgi:hypothetical protein
MPLTPTDTPDFPPIRLRGNGSISAHTRPMDKSGVPKEAQDDALSNGRAAAIKLHQGDQRKTMRRRWRIFFGRRLLGP